MHCTHCGQQLAPGTRFCPSCGTAVSDSASAGSSTGTSHGAAPPPPPGPAHAGPAYSGPAQPGSFGASHVFLRPRSGRMVAGVCAAFANAYGWNVTLIRILLVLTIPLHLGLGILAYFIAWIVIPEEPRLLPPTRSV